MEMVKNENEPIYDDKVKNAIRLITEGNDREETAKLMGYSNYKSLDIYIRRKNFYWNSDKQNYFPNKSRLDGITLEDSIAATSKVAQVLKLFDKENADAKVIANRLGFADHREMASYMAGKGYQWSMENKNYIKSLGLIEAPVAASEMDSQDGANLENNSIMEHVPNDKNSIAEQMNFQQFAPLLMMLQKNKGRLVDLLMPQSDTGTIPRYTVPGVFTTKSVHMVSPLDIMVRDFSREKNVSQRDIFATALLEFFKRYGYEREVEQLLGRK